MTKYTTISELLKEFEGDEKIQTIVFYCDNHRIRADRSLNGIKIDVEIMKND